MFDRVVIVDTETGGTDPMRHPLIQVAALGCAFPSLEVLEEFEAKIEFDPAQCEAEALAVNHYTPEAWKGALHPRIAAARFSSFLSRHARHPMLGKEPPHRPYSVADLIGHNIEFDKAFLWAWYRKLNEFFPAYSAGLCTAQLARWHAWGKQPMPQDFKLTTLIEHYKIEVPPEFAKAHDALTDVHLCRLLARYVLTGVR